MLLPKGGRGHKVPYETRIIRVPAPVLDEVEAIANRYRQSVLEGSEFVEGGSNPTFEQAVTIAKKIIQQKKSKLQSIAKLLQVIYSTDVPEQMLK